MIVFFIIVGVIIILLFGVVNLWSNFVNIGEYSFSRLKSNTFECGFDTKDTSRQPFSLRFFLIIIIFLVFDIELCMLLNFPIIFSWNYINSRLFFLLILGVLFFGVVEEWRRGFLYWK
uniref:NADH-ubiquinone oxidoreductase chain 3 n=1 Tax=Vorticeros sp. n. MW-2019 TaxID=2544881 RepID=A0AA49X7Z6_9PLAT|nr:NADH dehydrogenase subunit 3 [Vorticeros sp. n. MW-2019]